MTTVTREMCCRYRDRPAEAWALSTHFTPPAGRCGVEGLDSGPAARDAAPGGFWWVPAFLGYQAARLCYATMQQPWRPTWFSRVDRRRRAQENSGSASTSQVVHRVQPSGIRVKPNADGSAPGG